MSNRIGEEIKLRNRDFQAHDEPGQANEEIDREPLISRSGGLRKPLVTRPERTGKHLAENDRAIRQRFPVVDDQDSCSGQNPGGSGANRAR